MAGERDRDLNTLPRAKVRAGGGCVPLSPNPFANRSLATAGRVVRGKEGALGRAA